MVADAPTEQLKVILNEGDLSDDDHMFVYEEYKKRESRTSNTAKEITSLQQGTVNDTEVLQQGTVNSTEVLAEGKREAVKVTTNTVPQALNRAPAPVQSIVEKFGKRSPIVEQTGVTVENTVEGAVNTATSMAVGGARQNVALSEMMTLANNQMQNNQASSSSSTSGGATVLTQSDNSTNIQTTNVTSGGMSSPVDKSDRVSVRRGRRI